MGEEKERMSEEKGKKRQERGREKDIERGRNIEKRKEKAKKER